jgi:hypothetical protein
MLWRGLSKQNLSQLKSVTRDFMFKGEFMKVQYGVLFVENTNLYFSFREPGGVVKQNIAKGVAIFDLLDVLGNNGWELCDKNNILPPAASPDEWVFLRRLP